MAKRATWLTRLFLRDRDAAREYVARIFRRNHGNIMHAAYELGMDRRTLYRYLWRESLWQHVDESRAERAVVADEEPEWLAQTRKALRS